jgi:hypothetical protein
VKIWLDDRRPAPAGFVHVINHQEFETLLRSSTEVIEVMSFDHDLGEEMDGYRIAKWLAEHHLERWPLEVRVHSDNPPGAANIRAFDAFVRRRLLT